MLLDIGLPSTIHPGFKAYATSAVDVETAVLRGRPYGGLAIMWRSHLDRHVKVINYDDPRILGLQLEFNGARFLIINNYMLTQTADIFDSYMTYLGKLSGIINDTDIDEICISGEFNAKANY